MTQNDEPMLAPQTDSDLPESVSENEIIQQIKQLVSSQPFGVLCTQGNQQPYGSLIAYAVTDDFRSFYFSTPTATRKYRLLSGCANVALFVDSRSQFPHEMIKVEAVTITGRATELKTEARVQVARDLLTHQHPYIAHFYQSASTAFFRMDVVRYIHVARFQEVSQWIP